MRLKASIGLLSLVVAVSAFAPDNTKDAACYLGLAKAAGLEAGSSQRLPEGAGKVRRLQTAAGVVEVSRSDGYRLLYNNAKGAPFVNMKVEFSAPGQYAADTVKLLASLRYQNATGRDMETKELITLRYNGYTLYGLSRSSIDSGSLLGSFMMFPGDGATVYFDIQNLKPQYRQYSTLEEYKSLRNAFFGEYTMHLKGCLRKRN